MKSKLIVSGFCLSVLLMVGNNIFGQVRSENIKSSDSNSGKEIFQIVEKQPEFPGGIEAYKDFLIKNIHYPAKARKNNIEGMVYASFIVEIDGSLSGIQITKSLGYGCDEEVIRVISKMPVWIPGTQKGKAVRVKINMPVRFAVE